jgi:mannose-6-phosphate isomerase-like protein (cupin superfamily)
MLFPLLVGADGAATGLLTQALLEHQQLHALAGTLQSDLAAGDVPPGAMRELAHALEQHIRFEERTLFPLIENVASDEALRRLQGSPDAGAAVDTLSPQGTGLLWGAETDDLNATLLAWPPGSGPSEHVNSERDLLLVVLSGSATVKVDGEARAIAAGQAIVIEKGQRPPDHRRPGRSPLPLRPRTTAATTDFSGTPAVTRGDRVTSARASCQGRRRCADTKRTHQKRHARRLATHVFPFKRLNLQEKSCRR